MSTPEVFHSAVLKRRIMMLDGAQSVGDIRVEVGPSKVTFTDIATNKEESFAIDKVEQIRTGKSYFPSTTHIP